MTETVNSERICLKKKYKDLIFYILLIAIPLAQFCIFYIYVNFNSVLLAFKRFDYDTGLYRYVGVENFARVFRDFASSELVSASVKNSLIAYAVGLLFGTGLALLFSYYIYKKSFGQKFFQVMLFLPSIVSSVAMVMMFKYFTDLALPEVINKIFPGSEFIGFLSEENTRFGTLLFFCIWAGFGSNVLLYVGAMNGINDSIVEAAHLDGCGTMREFISITFPMIFPTFTTLFIVNIAGIATNQINAYLFYGLDVPPNCYTLGFYMFKDLVTGTAGLSEYPYLSAMGLVMTVVVTPIVLVVRKLLIKFGPSAE